MNLEIEQKHLDIVKNILKSYDYSFFAFGSRVSGNSKKFSDLDIFYFDPIPSDIVLHLEEEFEDSDLPFKIDLIDYQKCDADFQKLMLQNYLPIQEKTK